MYSKTYNQIIEQLRLAIEKIKERQGSELINTADYGLLNSVAKKQVIKTPKVKLIGTVKDKAIGMSFTIVGFSNEGVGKVLHDRI